MSLLNLSIPPFVRLFLGCYLTIGQISYSEVVYASLPKGAKQLTKEQLLTYVHGHFKKSLVRTDKKNIYLLDGLIICFWDVAVNPGFSKDIEDSQSESLALLKSVDNLTIISSEITTINNIKFLIYEYEIEDEVYLRFQSEFNKNNKDICGIIQFKKPDEQKAQATLQTFLQSVHFKE